jgi:hypothetical protein
MILDNQFLLNKISRCASSNNAAVAKEAAFVVTHIVALGSYEVMKAAICKNCIFDLIIPLMSV